MRRARWLADWKDSVTKPVICHCISRVVDRRFVFEERECEASRMHMRMYENFSGGERRHLGGCLRLPAGDSWCMAWFLQSASTPEEDLARFHFHPAGCRRSPTTDNCSVPQSATFDVQCSTFNVRIFCVRRRSSKPLEISPSIVNDEVTSGTADMLIATLVGAKSTEL